MKNLSHILFFFLIPIITISSCSEVAVPKPRGYFRITLPEHAYNLFDSISFPYQFEHSNQSIISIDNDNNAEPFWINIAYPKFNCKIHVTYKTLYNDNIDEALEDSRRLVYKHVIKADAIGENFYDDANKQVYGTMYLIKGNAATPLQFALTDSTNHLFRGALYFYCRPNKDSLAPVINYIEDDIAHIIETFKWNNKNAIIQKS